MRALTCVIVSGLLLIVKADFGGHDLFTSLAQLEVLWKNEIEVVKDMQSMIGKLERAKKSLEK